MAANNRSKLRIINTRLLDKRGTLDVKDAGICSVGWKEPGSTTWHGEGSGSKGLVADTLTDITTACMHVQQTSILTENSWKFEPGKCILIFRDVGPREVLVKFKILMWRQEVV